MEGMQTTVGTMAPLIEAKEGSMIDVNGERCMVVVDPKTRKLLIPCKHVFPTRAQHRLTIPSLCQLYLRGRCRQGIHCHQVHAAWDVVSALRDQVGDLPRCCVFHGDEDIGGVLSKCSWLSNAFIHIPESTYEDGYIPLDRTGYTIPVARLLNELPPDVCVAVENYKRAVMEGRPPREGPPKIVLEAGDIPICRLHIVDRCRYAEECSFLHLCREVAEHNPKLPLGRRSRSKVPQKKSLFSVSDSQGPQFYPYFAPSPKEFATPPYSHPSPARGFRVGPRGNCAESCAGAHSPLSAESDNCAAAASATSAPYSPNCDPLSADDRSLGASLLSYGLASFNEYCPHGSWSRAPPLSLPRSCEKDDAASSMGASSSTTHYAQKRSWRHDPYGVKLQTSIV